MEDSDIQPEEHTFSLISEKDPPEAPKQRKDTMNRTLERLFQQHCAGRIGARKALSKEASYLAVMATLC